MRSFQICCGQNSEDIIFQIMLSSVVLTQIKLADTHQHHDAVWMQALKYQVWYFHWPFARRQEIFNNHSKFTTCFLWVKQSWNTFLVLLWSAIVAAWLGRVAAHSRFHKVRDRTYWISCGYSLYSMGDRPNALFKGAPSVTDYLDTANRTLDVLFPEQLACRVPYNISS